MAIGGKVKRHPKSAIGNPKAEIAVNELDLLTKSL